MLGGHPRGPQGREQAAHLLGRQWQRLPPLVAFGEGLTPKRLSAVEHP